MTWMLTGGAGYIGAHVTRALIDSGRPVVVLDDLSSGLARKVPAGVPHEQIDVCDRAAVADALRRHEVTGVVHLAAKKAVGESVERPHFYYRQNVEGAMALTEAMAEVGVRRLVYSSSASVYGPTDAPLITEDTATLPISPYGQTKLIGEWIGADLAVAEGFSVVALRYFNVAGAGADDLGDTGAFNLIPMVLRAYTQDRRPMIFGADYPTPDGTCIRDYIHITDLAAGHVAAAVGPPAAPPPRGRGPRLLGVQPRPRGRLVGARGARRGVDGPRRRPRPRDRRPPPWRPAVGGRLGRPGSRRAGLGRHARSRRDVRERLGGVAGLPARLSRRPRRAVVGRRPNAG
jgi:UDP-glucose 4-epimerase